MKYNWEEKYWGEVCHIFNSDEIAVSILKVKKGFRCSRHYHKYRCNKFTVVSGKIEVLEWYNDSEVSNRYILCSDESVSVPSGRLHLFRVLEDGIVIEIYTQDGGIVDINDIIRLDEGGKDE